jgi:hypothetical protein
MTPKRIVIVTKGGRETTVGGFETGTSFLSEDEVPEALEAVKERFADTGIKVRVEDVDLTEEKYRWRS